MERTLSRLTGIALTAATALADRQRLLETATAMDCLNVSGNFFVLHFLPWLLPKCQIMKIFIEVHKLDFKASIRKQCLGLSN
jgi:hypothetical protein